MSSLFFLINMIAAVLLARYFSNLEVESRTRESSDKDVT